MVEKESPFTTTWTFASPAGAAGAGSGTGTTGTTGTGANGGAVGVVGNGASPGAGKGNGVPPMGGKVPGAPTPPGTGATGEPRSAGVMIGNTGSGAFATGLGSGLHPGKSMPAATTM